MPNQQIWHSIQTDLRAAAGAHQVERFDFANAEARITSKKTKTSSGEWVSVWVSECEWVWVSPNMMQTRLLVLFLLTQLVIALISICNYATITSV